MDRFQPLLSIVGSSNFTYPGLTGNNDLFDLYNQVSLITPEQTTIRTLIGQRAIQAGVSRERVLSVLQFPNEPMARFAQRHLRQSYQAFTQTDDVTALVDAVDDLRIRFRGSAEETDAPEADPRLPQETCIWSALSILTRQARIAHVRVGLQRVSPNPAVRPRSTSPSEFGGP